MGRFNIGAKDFGEGGNEVLFLLPTELAEYVAKFFSNQRAQ